MVDNTQTNFNYSSLTDKKIVSIPPDNQKEYIIKDYKLGEGSYAQTFLATLKSDQNQVFACKIIDKSELVKRLMMSHNPEDKKQQILKSLSNELNIAKHLQHTNIVKLHDFSETKNNYYFFMECCTKGTLEGFLTKSGGRFLESDAFYIFKQMVEGCKYLFDQSVFHRDLKPANVLINHQDIVKIADFGFCKKLFDEEREQQNKHTLVGTPYYMAPQILGESHYSIKCDVWSLGIMLYEMLFGMRPWYVDSNQPPQKLLEAIQTIPFKFPPNDNISKELKNLLQLMLQINEDNRINMGQVHQFVAEIEQHRIEQQIQQQVQQQQQIKQNNDQSIEIEENKN